MHSRTSGAVATYAVGEDVECKPFVQAVADPAAVFGPFRTLPQRREHAKSGHAYDQAGPAINAMIRLLSARYFAKSGFITTAWGQAFNALNMGMAERTPEIRAI